MTTRDAFFDGSIQADAGLSVSFTRAAATLDLAGTTRGVNTPRFAPRKAVAPAPAAFTATNSGQNRTRMAAGPNADMTAWQHVVYNGGSARTEVAAITEGTGALSATTNANLSAAPFTDGTIVRTPRAYCAAPGLIVALCEYAVSGSTTGVSFVVSLNAGTTWTVLQDYPSEPQAGVGRGREWAMRQWYTLERGSDVPNEVWIPAVDYREAGSPAGWCGFLIRATRANPASAWSLTIAKIRQHDRAGFLGATFHAHSMGVCSDGEGGMIVIVPVGDTIDDNSIIKGTLAAGDDWTDPADWVWDDSWSGAFGDPNTGATEALQFVGISVGPQDGEFLLGSDTQDGAIFLVNARDTKGSPKLVYKPALSDTNEQECFAIVNPYPHDPLRFGWAAHSRPKAGLTGEGSANANYGRYVRSYDGIRWTEVMSGATGSSLFANTLAMTPQNLYVSSHLGAAANIGVNRIPLPPMTDLRGLVLGDGGSQSVLDTYTPTPGTGVTITDVTASLSGLDVPPVPSYGKVWRCVRAANQGQQVFDAVCTSNLASGRIAGRVWIYNRDPGGGGQALSFTDNGGAGNLQPVGGGTALFLRNNEWFAIDLQGNKGSSGTVTLRLTTATRTPLDLLVCIDYFASGSLPVPFPIEGNTSTVAAEQLTISGFSAATAMTLYHAMALDDYAPDARWADTTTHPIGTLFNDANNYILLEALMATGQIRMTVVEDGSTVGSAQTGSARWGRAEQVLLGLAYHKANGTVQLTYSNGGGLPAHLSLTKGSAFTTLEPTIWKPAQGVNGTRALASVQMACRTIDGQADDQTTRTNTLTSLDWITKAIRYSFAIVANDTLQLRVRVVGPQPTNANVPGAITVTGSVSGTHTATLDVGGGAVEYVGGGEWEIVLTMTLSGFAVEGETLTLSADAGAILADPNYESVAFVDEVVSNASSGGSPVPIEPLSMSVDGSSWSGSFSCLQEPGTIEFTQPPTFDSTRTGPVAAALTSQGAAVFDDEEGYFVFALSGTLAEPFISTDVVTFDADELTIVDEINSANGAIIDFPVTNNTSPAVDLGVIRGGDDSRAAIIVAVTG